MWQKIHLFSTKFFLFIFKAKWSGVDIAVLLILDLNVNVV